MFSSLGTIHLEKQGAICKNRPSFAIHNLNSASFQILKSWRFKKRFLKMKISDEDGLSSYGVILSSFTSVLV